MNKKKLFLLSLFSGGVLSLAWWDLALAPLMLIAFLPLLWVEKQICERQNEKRFYSWAAFLYSYPAFLIWNATTIYWVAYSTPVAIALPFFEAALMSLTFQLAHFCKKAFGANKPWTPLFFPLCFLAFEWLQLNWDLNFPWLNLGNSFAKFPALVQWYEFTGVAGGTLWIWLCNLAFLSLISKLLKRKDQKAVSKNYYGVLGICFGVLLFPICVSLLLWFKPLDESGAKAEVVIVQPNLDPYSEQYDLSPRQVCDRIIELTAQKATENTDFILCPESCLQEYAWEENLESSFSIEYLRRYENRFPKAEIIAGISTRKMLPEGTQSKAARKHPHFENLYYESCNVAVKIDRDTLQPHSPLHRKSVLTPAVEKMPFKSVLGFLGDLALDLGGTVGTLGTEETPKVFSSLSKPTVAVPICYESADGGYVASMVRQGAQMLFIITNDGWWNNSPGHRQHAAFASLRAIENHRPIARSANTGISCFISPKGKVSEQTEYWTRDARVQTLTSQSRITFYTTYGDYIYRVASFVTVLFALLSFVSSHLRKAKEKTNTPKQ